MSCDPGLSGSARWTMGLWYCLQSLLNLFLHSSKAHGLWAFAPCAAGGEALNRSKGSTVPMHSAGTPRDRAPWYSGGWGRGRSSETGAFSDLRPSPMTGPRVRQAAGLTVLCLPTPPLPQPLYPCPPHLEPPAPATCHVFGLPPGLDLGSVLAVSLSSLFRCPTTGTPGWAIAIASGQHALQKLNQILGDTASQKASFGWPEGEPALQRKVLSVVLASLYRFPQCPRRRLQMQIHSGHCACLLALWAPQSMPARAFDRPLAPPGTGTLLGSTLQFADACFHIHFSLNSRQFMVNCDPLSVGCPSVLFQPSAPRKGQSRVLASRVGWRVLCFLKTPQGEAASSLGHFSSGLSPASPPQEAEWL